MENIAVEFIDVSKRYFVGEYSLRTLHEDIYRFIGSGLRGKGGRDKNEIWGLQNISFKIQRGENVGIIGPNGSGKTTLFKLISRLSFPTKGRVTVNGSVCSMIALNFAFHQELTGLENIYINATIYGMKRSEITKNIDKILSYAEVERFKHTPLKHYSAGMQARLGFSVAIHCPFDILLVDEVVAVADFSFKKKCFEKINEVQKMGKTVLFISHDLEKIRQMCSRVLYLSYGKMIADTDVEDAISQYEQHGEENCIR